MPGALGLGRGRREARLPLLYSGGSWAWDSCGDAAFDAPEIEILADGRGRWTGAGSRIEKVWRDLERVRFCGEFAQDGAVFCRGGEPAEIQAGGDESLCAPAIKNGSEEGVGFGE